MAQIRGPSASYGGPNAFGGAVVSADEEPQGFSLDTVRQYTSKIEDYLDTYSEPIKPWVLQSVSV
jgi:ER-derived vesicles protein